MKKNDYYKEHARILFQLVQQNECQIYLSTPSIYSHDPLVKPKAEIQVSYGLSQGEQTLKTEQAVYEAFCNPHIIKEGKTFSRFQEGYMMELGELSKEHQEFFLINSNALIGAISLDKVCNVIEYTGIELFCQFVKEGGKSLIAYEYGVIAKLGNILSHLENGSDVLLAYAQKHKKKISDHEYLAIELRDTVKKYFPQAVAQFEDFPYMQTANVKIVFETPIEKTLYLRLGMQNALYAYPSPDFTQATYNGLLKTLLSFMEKDKIFGLEKYHLLESRDEQSNYQHSHLYVNINNQSLLTKDILSALIQDFFVWSITQGIEMLRNKQDKEFIQIWLSKYVLDSQIQTNSKKTPARKI